jgi:hypothetical protein
MVQILKTNFVLNVPNPEMYLAEKTEIWVFVHEVVIAKIGTVSWQTKVGVGLDRRRSIRTVLEYFIDDVGDSRNNRVLKNALTN